MVNVRKKVDIWFKPLTEVFYSYLLWHWAATTTLYMHWTAFSAKELKKHLYLGPQVRLLNVPHGFCSLFRYCAGEKELGEIAWGVDTKKSKALYEHWFIRWVLQAKLPLAYK